MGKHCPKMQWSMMLAIRENKISASMGAEQSKGIPSKTSYLILGILYVLVKFGAMINTH